MQYYKKFNELYEILKFKVLVLLCVNLFNNILICLLIYFN